jgi:recA bacterial DNA recombination protein
VSRVATGIPDLDAYCRGGFPRGQLSELVGPRSSGRATAVHAILAAATRRSELTALVDTLDSFDPPSAAAARLDLTRLLWVRGPSLAHGPLTTAAPHGPLMQAAVERAVKAFNLILQAGRFGVVVLDLADVPAAIVRRLPFTTWLRLQRALEGGETAGLLVAEEHLGRSARGITVQLPIRSSNPENLKNPENPQNLVNPVKLVNPVNL